MNMVELKHFGYVFQNQYWRSISPVCQFCRLAFSWLCTKNENKLRNKEKADKDQIMRNAAWVNVYTYI